MSFKEYSGKKLKHVSPFIAIYLFIIIFANEGSVKADENMIGPGHYVIEKISTCENEDMYPLRIAIDKHKINRTHDVYDATLDLQGDLNEQIAIHIEIFKLVDGGYKPYYTLQHKCACCFIKKYAQENFERLLSMATVDPPDCPVPEGSYNVTDFLFDNDELPDEGVYGEYSVKCTMRSILNEDMACIMMNINFLEDD